MWPIFDNIAAIASALKRGVNPTPEWTRNLLQEIRRIVMDRTAELVAEVAKLNDAIAVLSEKVGELPVAIAKEAEDLKALIAKLESGDTVDVPAVIATLQGKVENIQAIAAAVSDAKAGIDKIVDSAPVEPPVQ
jgi:uncharacterized coiled-coil protein SlyX